MVLDMSEDDKIAGIEILDASKLAEWKVFCGYSKKTV